ncbi:hypothetical protein Tco_0728494 [Tanacetum coccineum]|uniref:Uncharacterized protein n=1 Tax=Tanacetum coccineum TaxID=301880 RepID=A0ABQ4YLA1_9ASTR
MIKVQKFCQRCKRVGLKQIAQQNGDSWKDLLLEKNLLGIGLVMSYDRVVHWSAGINDEKKTHGLRFLVEDYMQQESS